MSDPQYIARFVPFLRAALNDPPFVAAVLQKGLAETADQLGVRLVDPSRFTVKNRGPVWAGVDDQGRQVWLTEDEAQQLAAEDGGVLDLDYPAPFEMVQVEAEVEPVD